MMPEDRPDKRHSDAPNSRHFRQPLPLPSPAKRRVLAYRTTTPAETALNSLPPDVFDQGLERHDDRLIHRRGGNDGRRTAKRFDEIPPYQN
jgi:hypothetical protein